MLPQGPGSGKGWPCHRRPPPPAGVAGRGRRRLQVGAHAIGGYLSLQRGHRIGEPADAVVGLGEEILPPGALAIALAPVALLLVLSAELPPHGHPDIVGGPGELVHGRPQLVEVIDHRQPAAVEPTVLDDERILARGEGEIALFNRHNYSTGRVCANVSARCRRGLHGLPQSIVHGRLADGMRVGR